MLSTHPDEGITQKTVKVGDGNAWTPLTHEAMLHAESFTNFDFVATWKIEEGETTPYLIAIGLSKSGYEKWLEDNDIDGNPEPEDIGNGIPYGFRYAFNIPMDKGLGDFNPPLFRLVFGTDGKPRIYLPEQVNEEGVTIEVLASCGVLAERLRPGVSFVWRIAGAQNSQKRPSL